MNILFHRKKSARIICFLLTLLMIFAWMPTPAYAATNPGGFGDGASDKFTLYVVGKDGNDIQAGQWTYDKVNATLTGAPFVKTGNYVYSGPDSMDPPVARIGVVTKYILLSDLINYAKTATSISISTDASIYFRAGDVYLKDGKPYYSTPKIYATTYGLERHYYPSYIIDQTFTTDGGIVPSLLAIKSWNTRNANDSQKGITGDGGYVISDDTTLVKGINFLKGKADDYNALRIFMGQQVGGNAAEKNLGGESLKWVTEMHIAPVYYDIATNITGGTATITTSDGYLKAAGGEAVSFKVTNIPSGKEVGSVYVTYGSGQSVNVTGGYTFAMPRAAATINVELVDGSDTSWYHDADSTFTLTTDKQLRGFAKLVNEGVSESGITKKDFAGKTVKLGANIRLAADGQYTVTDTYYQDGQPLYSGTFPVPSITPATRLWTPIGTDTAPFKGTFDGNGKTISGIYTDVSKDNQGLFGYLGEGSQVKNITVNGAILGHVNVGGIAGYAKGTTITGAVNNALIYASGGVGTPPNGTGISRAGYAGGIVGYGDGTTSPVAISYCGNNGSVTVPNCYKGGRAGGIVGIFNASDQGSISKCYNTGTIKAYQYPGGIIGMQWSPQVTVSECYNKAKITGTSTQKVYVGGIAGLTHGTVTNCYNLGEIGATGDHPTRYNGIIGSGENQGSAVNCYSSTSGFGYTGYESTETNCYGGTTIAAVSLGALFTDAPGRTPVLNWEIGKITTDSGITHGAVTVTSSAIMGDTVNVTAPAASGYQLAAGSLKYSNDGGVNYIAINGSSFIMPRGDVVVVATFEIIPSGKSGSGGGGGGGDTGTGSASFEKGSDGIQRAVSVTNTPATTDASGNAKAAVTGDTLNNTLKSAQASAKSADDKAGNKSGTTSVEVKVEVSAAANAKSVETALPVDTLKEMAAQKNTLLTVSSPIAEITLDQKTLDAIVGQAGGKVSLSTEKIDKTALPAAAQEKVGDAPVYDLKVLGASGTVSDFKGGSVTVSIPYELKAGETAKEVTVYYINDKGELTKMSCTYNSKTKTATFVTNHFSYYTVVTEPAAKFADLNSSAYYYDAVNYAVKTGLFNGTGENVFSPAAGMTRAMFVTVLGRASGADVSKYSNSVFSDVASGTWYSNSVQWAYESKIVSGTGEGRFSPNQQITRNQMAAILTNYCKWKGLASDSAAQLTYTDLAAIPGWAKEGVTFCTAKGWITGYPDGSFLPGKTATRAEAATVLYKSLAKIK